jgi:capsular exopolysaccharide synthesis family protein
MSLAGAIMAALALGYLRSVSDPRIHEMEDIQNFHQAPFLGRLPLLAKMITPAELGGPSDRLLPAAGARQDSMNSYPGADSLTALLEEVRMVRTSLLERLGRSDSGRAILITSPTSQVGKTSLALLLARSLAATGKKVLLVEGDFYRPALAERLKLVAGAGLASLLARTSDDVQAIRRTYLPSLDVLPVGEMREAFNPDVLANGVFASCMARWRQAYDFVVLDSPPVLPVADARILAGHADGALLVVKATHNRRMEALAAFQQLAATHAGVLGIVMIGGYTPAGSYHYGYSSYGYAAAPAAPGTAATSRKESETNPEA